MQTETEATIHLMLAARHINHQLTLAESEHFNVSMERLPWDSGTSKSYFLQSATAAVRKAMAAPEAMETFLRAQAAAYQSPESRKDALALVSSVLESDGLDEKEQVFLKKLNALLR